MAPKGSGSRGAKNTKKQKGSPSDSEDMSQAMPVLSPPVDPGMAALVEPIGGSGAEAGPDPPNPVFITEEMLAISLGGLEKRLAAMIANSLPDKKRTRSPSPKCVYSDAEVLSLGDLESQEDLVDQNLEGSELEDSTVEEPFSASQAESLWIQSLTDMVRSAFKLPSPEPRAPTVSSLGSLKAPLNNAVFPVHPLLEELIYQDWVRPDRIFLPPKRFSVIYPMEEKFSKKWAPPAVDAAISCVNKTLTCPVENIQMFKDPVDKRLETLLKASFATAGAVVQPAVAAIGVCQALKVQTKQMLKDIPAQQAEELSDIPRALCFAVDAIKDSIQQASRLSLLVVHMRRLLWLKNWAAEPPCKKLLAGFPFHGGRLFGEDLDKYIQTISSGKSTLLPVKKKFRGPAFKRPISPVPGPSNSRQYRRPPARSNFNNKSQGQAPGGKRPWYRKPTKPAPKSAL